MQVLDDVPVAVSEVSGAQVEIQQRFRDPRSSVRHQPGRDNPLFRYRQESRGFPR